MNLFPYHPRKNQVAIMQTIKNTLQDRSSIIFESGTGSGKTICTLTATLEFALQHGKKIIYTTRTNAQQRQVIIELREIKKKLKDNRDQVFGIGIQGRANMCLIAKNDPEFAKGTADELSKMCSNQKKKARSTEMGKGCIYYRNFLQTKKNIDEVATWAKKNLPTAEELIAYCERRKLCAYEINKLLIRESILVVVPYVYVFDINIRNALFDWLSVAEQDMILVVDEAHNLPDYIRDLYSAILSTWMLNSCMSEADTYGNPSLLGGRVMLSGFCKHLIDIIRDLRDTYIYGVLETGLRKAHLEKEDAFIPSHELELEILGRLKITSKRLADIIEDLIVYGEKIQEYREKEGKLPRSYLHKLGVFLDFWVDLEMNQYIKLVVDDSQGKNPRIETYCLDPSVGTSIIGRFHSSVHMSGTLEPLEEYRDSMGLPKDTRLVSYPSPFPERNRKIFYVRDVTTKYAEMSRDTDVFERMKHHITNVCNSFPLNTMVFFPSFNILSMFRRDHSFHDINRCVFIEEREMSQAALMDLVADFKERGSGEMSAALFSVIGGRISEGMDFPADELEIAVIVGIPYPKPTARQRGLRRYYDLKFRKGWEYTVEAPTARKLLQAIGRLIRDDNDRGVAVILDRRAVRFKKYITDLTESKNLVADIRRFMDA